MADHRAEQIMAAVVTTVTGLTTTAANVSRGRVYPTDDSAMPALSVYMGADEPVGEPSIAYQDESIAVRIVAHVKATTALETTLNKIKKEVYVAMLADRSQGLAFVHDTKWQGADEPELQDGVNKPVATMTMNFSIQYRHSYADPSA